MKARIYRKIFRSTEEKIYILGQICDETLNIKIVFVNSTTILITTLKFQNHHPKTHILRGKLTVLTDFLMVVIVLIIMDDDAIFCNFISTWTNHEVTAQMNGKKVKKDLKKV